MGIDRDLRRFEDIVRGKVRDNLREYMQRGSLKGQQGNESVSIPIDRVDLPKFTHGSTDGGVGQGEGQPGDQIADGDGDGDGGEGEAGKDPGEHAREVEVSYEELAELMAEELELPNIEPKGDDQVETSSWDYRGMNRSGPETLRNFKETYKQALKRQISTGTYDPEDPEIIPIKDDKRYRSVEEVTEPESNAVMIYMMDVSGSMGGRQKETVRNVSFWIDTRIRSQYDGVESRYLIHDAQAREVGRDEFFTTKESGGTMVSSAYNLCAQIMEDDYPASNWNVYAFHFSDGDNWSSEDTNTCMELLEDALIPGSNLFGYGQVESAYGSGKLIKPIRRSFGESEGLVAYSLEDNDDTYDAIKAFLGTGR